MGFLGNSAPLIVDVNLVLQYVVLLLIIIGYIKKKPYKTHGQLMALATIINLITILTIMAPILIQYSSLLPPTIYLHAVVGGLASILSLIFVFRFFIATRAGQPLACGKRWQMFLVLIFWFIPILGGTFFYISTYA